MTEKRVKVGIIGCGNIIPAYFKGCKVFPILDVVACADIDMSRAQAKAAEYGAWSYAACSGPVSSKEETG